MSNFNTPYDDAFRTLLTDCSRLIVPLVNEIFHEDHPDNAEVELFQNELFITCGDDKKRITDSNFSIEKHGRYHIECQSSTDGTIIIRVFEYATQIAITTAVLENNETIFTLPRSGILYLRSTRNTLQGHTITISAPDGNRLSYNVPAIAIQDYSIEEILNKKLWFLIPFYFFNFNLTKMDSSPEMIEEMKNFYKSLWLKLDEQVEKENISEYEKCAIKAMCDKVANALADNFSNVMEGVENIMGGQILDYEAKRIAREAAEKAAAKAAAKATAETKISEGIEAVVKMFSKGKMSEDDIRDCYPEQFEAGKAKYLASLNELKEM